MSGDCSSGCFKCRTVKELIKLYEDYGSSDYIGEKVTQIQHALQAADNTKIGGYGDPIMLGAFFHDIGHLVGEKLGLQKMVTGETILGIKDHAEQGQSYLESLGVNGPVSQLVGMHVQAKRYLVAVDTDYYEKLSDASKMTLVHQGGPMTEQEVVAFEQHPLKEAVIRMRKWDEQAKHEHVYADKESMKRGIQAIREKLALYLHTTKQSTRATRRLVDG